MSTDSVKACLAEGLVERLVDSPTRDLAQDMLNDAQTILELQGMVSKLSLENENLIKQLAFKDNLLKETSRAIIETSHAKKKKHLSEKGIWRSCKWVFYKEHKNDVEILGPIQREVGGAYANSPQKYKPMLWNLVKCETDKLFDAMDGEQQQRYYHMVA